MRNKRRPICALCLVFFSSAPFAICAQNQPSPAGQVPLTANYPTDKAGVLIQSDGWSAVANQNPTKTKVAHALAAGLSYGLAPAKVVAEYDGEHAATQIESTQPVICVCHFSSIPGAPVLVRLHSKKGARELNGGKMIVYPVVGGSKMADANKPDLIPADVSQPDPQVWLVRPQFALEPGEYALMLGTQNVSIFPFTVAPPPSQAIQSK
jgi:hypothetical protein